MGWEGAEGVCWWGGVSAAWTHSAWDRHQESLLLAALLTLSADSAFHLTVPFRILHTEAPVSDKGITQGVEASFGFIKLPLVVTLEIVFHQLKWKPTNTFCLNALFISSYCIFIMGEKKSVFLFLQLKQSQKWALLTAYLVNTSMCPIIMGFPSVSVNNGETVFPLSFQIIGAFFLSRFPLWPIIVLKATKKIQNLTSYMDTTWLSTERQKRNPIILFLVRDFPPWKEPNCPHSCSNW